MSLQPSDFDKDATSDEGIWRECAERLRVATATESENRIKGIEAKRFRWGEQWDADVRNTRKIDGRPALTINHTNTFCQRQENTLRQQRPRIKCHPVGDGADVDTAAVVNGLIRHIEDRSTASVAYDLGVKNSVDIGWGYWRVVSEYIDARSFDQELLIKPIRNPFTVYMDPASVMPDGRDQYWCIISETMKRAEYKRRYPRAENSEWRYVDAPGDMTLDWESKEEVRLAEYYRIHEVRDTLIKFSDGSVKYRSELADPNVIAAVGLTIVAERPTTRRAVQWFRLNGKTVVDHSVDPGEHIPVVRCEGNVEDVNGRVLRKGMVEDLKDPAQMTNYWRFLSTDTPIPTPTGWSTMGALRTGDEVFDEHGKPTKIIGKSAVKIRERCYRITFGDGSKVVAGWDHPWKVEERGKRVAKSRMWSERKVTTEELTPKKHFIAVAKPLECDEAALPIHPYLLGLWLGDGTTNEPSITPGNEDIDEVRDALTSLRYQLGAKLPGTHADKFTVLGVRQLFRQIGVLGQKHVPKSYLRASIDQRWALLRGFMDSDGSIGKHNRQCSYTTTNWFIAEGFQELVRSLGIRLSVLKREGRRSRLVGADSIVQPFWQFSFSCYADEPAFGLKRKQVLLPRVTEHRRRTKRHSIVSVEPIASVPVQCLGIDTPTHLFLCGESMIPTHNTAETERYALAPKAPWVAAEGQLEGHPEWNDANQKSYSTLIYKPIAGPDGMTALPPPQRTNPAQVEAGMQEAANGAYRDLMSIAGVPQEDPELRARIVSGNKHLQRRQGMQDLAHFQYYDNQTLAIAWTGVLILERLPAYYDTQRMQRIIREDGQPEMVELNARSESPENPAVQIVKNDMSVGRYAVVMDTGPGYATKREEASENLVELLGTPLGEQVAQTSGDIVIRNMDFYGADEVADRLAVTIPGAMEKIMEGLPKQAQTIIGSLQAQMQQKDEQIKHMALEIKYGAQMQQMKGEQTLEKTDKDNATKLAIAGISDATKREDIETDATTRRDVAEIGAAAQLLNSHMESRSEEKMADKMIRQGTEDRRDNGAGK